MDMYSIELEINLLGYTNTMNLEVEYLYSPGYRGARGEFGIPIEPDEPADVEINEIYYTWISKGQVKHEKLPEQFLNNSQIDALRNEIKLHHEEWYR